MDKREGLSGFSVENFCLKKRKKFEKKAFCVSRKILVSKIFMDKGVLHFSVEKFCLRVLRRFVGDTAVLQKNSRIEIFYG